MKKVPGNDRYKYSGMVTKMGLIIAAAVFGGIKLDEYLGFKTPWMTILFSLLGVGLSMYVIIRDATKK